MPTPMAGALDHAVANHVRLGWAVESRSETMAVLVGGNKPNHVLHLLITLATCGFWGIVWIIIAVTSKVSRVTLMVNSDGSVTSHQS